MSTDDDGIIDAEIVEDDRLPAVIEPEGTHEGAKAVEAQPREDGRDWPHGPLPERRCRAHSSRTGEPCKNAAIKGGTVCRFHGGAAKQVKANARARLENAADLMAKQLLGIALTAESESVKLAAIRDALDRSGLKAPSEVVLSHGETKPYEQVFDVIGGNPSDAISAGDEASPAPAYGDTGQIEAESIAAENREPSCDSGPLREAEGREFDREPQPQDRQSARSQRTPTRRETHITGMAAIQLANQANRAAGVFDEQRAIESRHKRYGRP